MPMKKRDAWKVIDNEGFAVATSDSKEMMEKTCEAFNAENSKLDSSKPFKLLPNTKK